MSVGFAGCSADMSTRLSQIPPPIPLPWSPRLPARCRHPPSSAASCRNMRGRSPRPCRRRRRSQRRARIPLPQAGCREARRGCRPMRRRPIRSLKPTGTVRRVRSRQPMLRRRAAPRSSSAPAIRSISWRALQRLFGGDPAGQWLQRPARAVARPAANHSVAPDRSRRCARADTGAAGQQAGSLPWLRRQPSMSSTAATP